MYNEIGQMFSEDEWLHWNGLQQGDKRLTIAQLKTKWQQMVQDKNDGKKVMSDCKDGTLRFWIKTDDQIVFSNKSVKRRFVEARLLLFVALSVIASHL